MLLNIIKEIIQASSSKGKCLHALNQVRKFESRRIQRTLRAEEKTKFLYFSFHVNRKHVKFFIVCLMQSMKRSSQFEMHNGRAF